jgi:hypothetical protein
MKKRLLNIVLALTVVIAGFTVLSNTANAEEVGYTWNVEYDGKDIDSPDYVEPTKETTKTVMPGDTLYYEVTYHNLSDKAASFYLNADVLASLEQGSEASGGAYSYVITNTVNGTTTELFNSLTVGGDNSDVIGLTQVKPGEGSYFSLGSIPAKTGEGTIRVEVKLDGNTQNNSYMGSLASLGVSFGAEPTSEAEDGGTVVKEIKNTVVRRIVKTLPGGTQIVIIDDDDIPLAGNPRTGDSILPIVMCGLALVLGLLMIAWYFMLTKNDRREEA